MPALTRPPNPWLAEDTFLAAARDLFWTRQNAERDEYERLIYDLAPPAGADLMQKMAAFRGGSAPGIAKDDGYRAVASVMRKIRYPDTSILMDCKDVEGLDLSSLSKVLHFHHPAYPIFSQKAVDALNRIGHPIVYNANLDEDGVGSYAGYIATLDRLKHRIHFTEVPESNCFLTRIVEAALMEY